MTNKLINNINRVSKLFQPIKMLPKGANIKADDSSKSYRLMLDMGIIKQANTGMYTLLPLGYRVLDKLTEIVDEEMTSLGAQKMLLPNLTSTKLWEKSGRLGDMGQEMLKVKDRHSGMYVLSPTYEEAITQLVAIAGPAHKSQLPLLLYQISNKWRDEMKPRLGLFRTREFIMKDLYSFDMNDEDAEKTYQAVNEAYKNIFTQIGLPFTIAIGDTGLMGGSLSHEYHYLSEIGEDTVLSCSSCGFHVNSMLHRKDTCNHCHKALIKQSAVEVGHTFLLGKKYSKVFNANCRDGDSLVPLVMGCFGLGLTRIMSASAEILSTNDELRWPKSIAPFTVCVLPPKENSKEYPATHYAETIIQYLHQRNIDFIVDDRIEYTIGRRFLDCRRTGYPYLIIVGKNAIQTPPTFELHDIHNGERLDMSLDQLMDFFGNSNNIKQEERKEAAV